MPASIDLLGWNVEQGGYDRRHVFDTSGDPTPEREEAIKSIVSAEQLGGVDTLSLIDTYGWRQRYGDDKAIAKHLRFETAAFVDLEDDRITRLHGPGMGLTFATDQIVEKLAPLDLDNRQGIQAILNLGGRALQVATLYLDDMNEETRLYQLRAALSNLEPDEPTILIGDLNTLRPNLENASPITKIRDLGFRALVAGIKSLPEQETIEALLTRTDRSHLAAKVDYYRRALTNLNKRQVVPELEQRGFKDADPKKRPTFHKLGKLGVDYAFHTQDLQINKFQVIPVGKASDHDAIRVRTQLTNS